MTGHKIIIPIRPKQKILTSNQRLHWAQRAELTKIWRAIGAWKVKEAHLPTFTHAQVDAYIYKPTKRKYDPANLYPTFKAIMDGFTDAGIWEDDNYEHVDGPHMHHGGVDPQDPRYEIIIKEIQE